MKNLFKASHQRLKMSREKYKKIILIL